MIPFYKPDVSFADAAAVVESLGTGWITRGDKCRNLENALVSKYGAKGAFVSDSNTACMELALRYLGIRKGDEVITTPYTYSATADIIYNIGAKIVFCDLREGSYEMDYDKLAELINENTKAVIPVDIGGVPCNYGRIFEVVNYKKNVFMPSTKEQEMLGRIAVISDSAHSINCAGSGTNADFTAFSFHAVKNVTCGEGGALLWTISDADAYRRIGLLADHGQTGKTDIYKYDIELFGQNHIMTDYAAAIALSQLRRVDEITTKRRSLTMKYKKFIRQDCEVLYSEGSACHLLMVRLPNECNRDDVARFMNSNGIGVNVHYIPLPMFTAYKNIGFDIKDYPKAYKEFTREITLPLYNGLDMSSIREVCGVLDEAVRSGMYERSFF